MLGDLEGRYLQIQFTKAGEAWDGEIRSRSPICADPVRGRRRAGISRRHKFVERVRLPGYYRAHSGRNGTENGVGSIRCDDDGPDDAAVLRLGTSAALQRTLAAQACDPGD